MRLLMRFRPSVESLEVRDTPALLYVSPTGADSNPGTAAAPLLTLQKAADRVAPGDTVSAAPGNYAGFNLFTSGTATRRITFQGDAGGVVIDRPNPWNSRDGINLEGASFVTVQGFTVRNQPRAGIRAVQDQFVVIRNNVADANAVWGIFTGFSADLLVENNQASRSAQQHGIYVSNSADRPTVRGNSVFENKASGIQLNADASQGGDGVISNAVIENNVLRANGAGGGASINLDGVQDSDIRNNLIQDARASGIALFRGDGATGSSNNRVVNNTVVVDNALNRNGGRWAVTLSDASTGNVLKNNILYSTSGFPGAVSATADSLPGLVSDFNAVEGRFSADGGGTAIGLAAWRAATGQDAHSLTLADATALNGLFVDRAAGNYHLRANSAAIDRGTAAGAPRTDFEGNARPSGAGIDIGADEFVVAVSPPVTPPVSPPPVTNTAPTATSIANQIFGPADGGRLIVFRVGDAQTPVKALTYTVTSSNPAVVPVPKIYALGGPYQLIYVIPARNVSGTSVITVTVRDAGGLTATISFTVTVRS